jgi:hypothetical protein
MKALLRGLSARDVEYIGQDPKRLATFAKSGAKPGGDSLILDRTWHVIHFLLCGQPWDGPDPLKYAVLGGVELSGPASGADIRVLGPEPVARVALALTPLTAGSLLARFDLARLEFAEIYPGGWGFGTFDWPAAIRADFPALQAFYQRRALAADAVLIHID